MRKKKGSSVKIFAFARDCMFSDGGYDGKEKGTCHSLQTFSLRALYPDMISSADFLDLMVQHDLW